ncbi:hypothetical protein L3Q82_000149 [Scortum barcoo]|uniref:Uncharacterized protein n=1 Tax=Scortum barcoo TaxID=214431 RepID=A0ACB8XDI3_9TELE|nr:hypothetical protein L3Q82_000149 [Scortum barcoo]
MHLVGKLGLLGFSTPLCNWLLDFLTERPQSATNHVVKFADDATVVGDLAYREEVEQLIQPSHAPLLINNTAVEVVSSTKFLGVHITDDLTWSVNTASLVKRAQQRLHFLMWMKRAHLPPPILSLRSTGVLLESILTKLHLCLCGAEDALLLTGGGL